MKTSVIYCPAHRLLTSPQKRWAKIAALLDECGVEYDMVQSENAQSVRRLVAMMVNNGYDNIIIAGGDSALNDAVNCLMKQEKHVRENIAIGIIPNGTINDFAAYWGFDYDDPRHAIESIAQRRIRKVDVGFVRYTDTKNNGHMHYFIDSVNFGLLARIQKLRLQARHTLVSRKLSYAVSMACLVFQKLFYKVTYRLNDVTERHRITTLCIGSAWGYGQLPNAVPYNGMLDMTAVRTSPWTQFSSAAVLFLRGKFLNHKRVLPYRTRKMELECESKLPISIDGRPEPSPRGPVTIGILPEEINFIIEK